MHGAIGDHLRVSSQCEMYRRLTKRVRPRFDELHVVRNWLVCSRRLTPKHTTGGRRRPLCDGQVTKVGIARNDKRIRKLGSGPATGQRRGDRSIGRRRKRKEI